MNHRRYPSMPDHVRHAALDSTVVLVNYRTNTVQTLIGPAARWWTELADTGDPAATGVLDADAARTLLDQLHQAGMIESTRHPQPWPPPVVGPSWEPSWGTHELAAGLPAPVPVPLGATLRALLAVVVVLGTLAVGRRRRRLARLVSFLTWFTGRTTRPASAERAHQAVHAVRNAAHLLVLGRVGCLEESAATTMLLAASRHWVNWRHGVANDPLRLHAWVETDDSRPVAEPPSTARYCVLRTIPE